MGQWKLEGDIALSHGFQITSETFSVTIEMAQMTNVYVKTQKWKTVGCGLQRIPSATRQDHEGPWIMC